MASRCATGGCGRTWRATPTSATAPWSASCCARGYVASLLRECSLGTDQRIEDEDEGSDFELRVTATVPATGQLLRWLLGCGDKVQVIEPKSLRTVMAAQTAKAACLYAQGAGA